MKNKYFVIAGMSLFLFATATLPVQAGPSKKARTGIGAGIGFGEFDTNVFISGKHWLKTPGRALDFSIDFGDGFFGGTINYLFHKFYLFKGDLGRKLPLYYGGGAAVFSANTLWLGGQAKAGLNYFFDGPFDCFLEFSPIMFLTPDVTLGIGGALGGRYYF